MSIIEKLKEAGYDIDDFGNVLKDEKKVGIIDDAEQILGTNADDVPSITQDNEHQNKDNEYQNGMSEGKNQPFAP